MGKRKEKKTLTFCKSLNIFKFNQIFIVITQRKCIGEKKSQ